MSINIGADAVAAITELRGDKRFEGLLLALDQMTDVYVSSSIVSDVPSRVDKTAYARGMRHLWHAMASAYVGVPPAQLKPGKRNRLNSDDLAREKPMESYNAA